MIDLKIKFYEILRFFCNDEFKFLEEINVCQFLVDFSDFSDLKEEIVDIFGDYFNSKSFLFAIYLANYRCWFILFLVNDNLFWKIESSAGVDGVDPFYKYLNSFKFLF